MVPSVLDRQGPPPVAQIELAGLIGDS